MADGVVLVAGMAGHSDQYIGVTLIDNQLGEGLMLQDITFLRGYVLFDMIVRSKSRLGSRQTVRTWFSVR